MHSARHFCLQLCYFLLFSSLVSAQQLGNAAGGQLEIKPLAIGDTVPEDIWEMSFQMLQADKESITVKMSDYRGKVILLDYWATWCTGCILNMPRIHEAVHGLEDVVLLPVTNENEEVVQKFLSITASESIAKVRASFRSIVGSNVLADLVPHRAIPFVAIINKDGILEQNTLPTLFDRSILQAIAHGKDYYIPEYRASLDKPFLTLTYTDVRQKRPLYYSTMMGMQEGFVFPDRTIIDSVNNVIKGYYVNISVMRFLDLAIGANGASIKPNNRIMLVDTPSRFDYFNARNKNYDRRKNTVAYEFSFPMHWDKAMIKNKMHLDANDYLGLYAKMVSREMPCLVLRLKKNANLPVVDRGERYGFVYNEILVSSRYEELMGRSPSGAKNYSIGEDMESVVFTLNNIKTDVLPRVIDETGSKEHLLIDYPDNMSSVDDLIEVLDRQGIAANVEMRKVDMYVLDSKPIDEKSIARLNLALTKFGYVPVKGEASHE